MDKEHINDNEKSENPVNDTYDGKEKIIRENGGYSLLGNDIKYYVEIYNKLRPYRVLKIINSILLIILFVGSILASRYNLRWSNSMPSTMHCISHDAPPRYSTYCVSTGDTFAVGQLILVVLGLISLIYHHFAKNIFKAAVCSLMDICFFLLSFPILLFTTFTFTKRSFSLYHWLAPKLAKFNYTFEAYVDITETYMWKNIDGFRMDQDSDVLDEIVKKKKEIIINVLINPSFAFLTAITLILNIFIFYCLYKKMSNAKLWMDGLNDYMISFPDCSPIEQKYALLGKIKIILWLMPLFPLLSYVYITYFRINNLSVRHFWAPTIFYFIHWLLYYCTLHLRCPKGKADKPIRLSNLFFADLIFSYFFTFLFIICASIETRQNLLFIISIILYGGYSLMLSFIYLRNKKGSFNFKLPISIKINFEINRKSKNDEKNNEEINSGKNEKRGRHEIK
ncbi:hypothetical protein ACQ4LE_001722 [Meloidogyne hapla]